MEHADAPDKDGWRDWVEEGEEGGRRDQREGKEDAEGQEAPKAAASPEQDRGAHVESQAPCRSCSS